jgi:hypothetical protein
LSRLTSATQPFCRWCGKPLKKAARDVHILPMDTGATDAAMRATEYSRYIKTGTPPKTRVECQALTNLHVVSVSRSRGGKTISRFGEWDGESYEASWDYFCTSTCAAALGRAAVRDRDICGPAYNKAVSQAAKQGDQK